MSSKKKLLFFTFLFLLIFFIFPSNINATFSFNISNSSVTTILSGGQEIDVSLNIIDLPSESYFRVALQKEGGGSYYGYIYNNNGEWSKILTLSSDCSGYFKVTDLTTTMLNLKYKIGEDSEITNGDYRLKAHRFTKTCTSYTEGTNSISVVVNLPTPTPSPTPIPTQEPTTAPTSVPTSNPTITSTPKLTPTKSPTPKPTKIPTETPNDLVNTAIPILVGLSGSTSTPESLVAGASTSKKSPIFSIILIILGLSLLTFGGINLYKKMKTEYNSKNESS